MSVLVLASSSAVRARLLAAAGVEAIIDPAAIDESRVKRDSRAAGHDAGVCAMLLAEAKAQEVATRHRGALVLGADQMLDCAGRWFDKPADRDEARSYLEALSGRQHSLITAAAVIRDGTVLWRALERSLITLRRFSSVFLESYLAAMDRRVLATVGGYELEGLGAQLMARIEGDYFAILGLPLLPLLAFLRDEGALAA